LDTGVDFEEVYRLNGRLHGDPKEGPALTLRDRASGLIANEEYHWLGRLHREDGPASIRRRIAPGTNEVVVEEEYRRYGWRHRDPSEGPAEIRRNETTGIVLHEAYWENNELHRDPAAGPAAIWRNASTGHVVSEAYWVRGPMHRDPADGAAVTERHPSTGPVTRERSCTAAAGTDTAAHGSGSRPLLLTAIMSRASAPDLERPSTEPDARNAVTAKIGASVTPARANVAFVIYSRRIEHPRTQ
jgi:hypothetical protein